MIPKHKTTIYVASAGTGKTTTLIKKLEEILLHTPAERVCYTTFTKTGALEIRQRVVDKNLTINTGKVDLKYFQTLHALCYQNTVPAVIMRQSDYYEFGRTINMAIYGHQAVNNDGTKNTKATKGDILLTLDNICRTTLTTPRETCANPFFQKIGVSHIELEFFSASYKAYKEANSKIDFTDQLERFLNQKTHLNIDYLLVDEAQDLSPLQWSVVEFLSAPCKEVVLAGDDKQSIFEFAGASPGHLINQWGTRIILDTTYRNPEPILKESLVIADRIKQKTPFTVTAKNREGTVQRMTSLHDLDLANGSWFFLVRNRAFFPYFEDQLLKKNVLFKSASGESSLKADMIASVLAWKELMKGNSITGKQAKVLYADYLPSNKYQRVKHGFKKVMESVHDEDIFTYERLVSDYGLQCNLPWSEALIITESAKLYLKALDDKGLLGTECKIEINTIHGVKGREADNVVILPDMTQQTLEILHKYPDSEHRVFYVAVTRARHNLFYHAPITSNYYML
jgi:superfamily I DNA/RNA helicase